MPYNAINSIFYGSRSIGTLNMNGNKFEEVPTSFDTGLPLDEEMSAEEFLNHSIR
jgi:hypothetical protein